MSQVLDYSDARPTPQQIKAKYIGVLRYVAPLGKQSGTAFGGADNSHKVITAAEYKALGAAGLTVVLNWEWYDVRPRGGAAAGIADAQEALRQANALGYTGPIYFSVDFDASEADQPAINAYIQACAQVIGKARLGAYGGYWPLKRLFDAGLITYGWQTLAWSGGQRESRAHLYQTGKQDLGACDINDVLKDNWSGGNVVSISGGWSAAKSAQYTVQPDGTLQGSNGQKVYGWILESMRRVMANPNNLGLFSVLYGLPTSDQAKDAAGNWWQSFEHCRVRVNSQNKDDFGFSYVSAQPPAPDQQIAILQAELQAYQAWLQAAPKKS